MADADRDDVDMDNASDSSSSDEEVEMDPADEKRIMDLESQLVAAPTVYDTHVQLIDLLRKVKLKERVRAARQRMQQLFPLNETQWMDWINDEMDAISSQEDIDRIKQLFQLAVQDYISVTLWESYLEFLQAADPAVSSKTAAGVDAFRQAAEAALTAAGLHLAEGHHLWQLYRAFEQGVLEDGAADEKQVDRVRSLFHRQLQLPQPDVEQLLVEYEAWEAERGQGAVPDHIRAAAKRSADAAQLRSSHEAAVSTEQAPVAGSDASASLLAAYMAYIQLEKAQKDPARVMLLYERALAAFPVTHELWLQYTRYLEAELKVPLLVNKAYARAVRNCPWVGALWAAALRAMERLGGASDAEHEALAEQALAAGMQGPEDYLSVLLARADCLRHQLPPPPVPQGNEVASKLQAWFSKSSAVMGKYFPDYLDRSLRLPGYAAHVAGVLLGDLQAMRAVWEEAVKGPLGRYYETWVAWVGMERGLRQLPAARSLFKRAYSRKYEEGGQLALAYEWIKFEREEGSAEDLFQASLKVEPLMEEARAAATAATNQPAAAAARAAAQSAQKKLSREEVKAMRRANDPNWKQRKPGTKRDHEGGTAAAADTGDAAGQSNKRTKSGDEPAGDTNMTDPGLQAAAAAAAAAAERPAYSDDHTVFVKGLGFDVAEEDLRRLFAELGVKSVRMGKDKFTGASRGFAYVDFESDEAVVKAAEKDGEVVNGRKLFIAKSAPPGGSRGRGRGRGREGRGRGWAGGAEGSDWGGRGGRGGGRDFGRGGGRRGGLGYHGDIPSAAHGNMGHMRHHLTIDEQKPGARLPAMVPRALITKQGAEPQQRREGSGGGNAAAAVDTKPKTNEDFKKMLQK